MTMLNYLSNIPLGRLAIKSAIFQTVAIISLEISDNEVNDSSHEGFALHRNFGTIYNNSSNIIGQFYAKLLPPFTEGQDRLFQIYEVSESEARER